MLQVRIPLAVRPLEHDFASLQLHAAPPHHRVGIHPGTDVLHDLAAAIFQRGVSHSLAVLFAPRLSCQEDRFLDEHSPASVRSEGHVAKENGEQHF